MKRAAAFGGGGIGIGGSDRSDRSDDPTSSGGSGRDRALLLPSYYASLPSEQEEPTTAAAADDDHRDYRTDDDYRDEDDDGSGGGRAVAAVPCLFYGGKKNSKIPRNITHVRVVDPSKTLAWIKKKKRLQMPSRSIPRSAFRDCQELAEVELCEGLRRIGQDAFRGCNSLRFVKVPSTVRSIETGAFQHCHELEEVELCEGLEYIEWHAFRSCRSLKRIRIPSTVKQIGGWAFYECSSLEEVALCEGGGLDWIGRGAFASCASLKQIRIPSTVKLIVNATFQNCARLRTVELCEGLRTVHDDAFRYCPSLRNAAYPPRRTTADRSSQSEGRRLRRGKFEGCHDLRRLFESHEEIEDALTDRFRGLPVHRLCYYHTSSHRPISGGGEGISTIEALERMLGDASSENKMHGKDCLGMTPLHILACSTGHDLDLYTSIVRHSPESLVARDGWGCPPLLYAIWGDAPREIVRFLIVSQRISFPNAILDFDGMAETLCRGGTSLDAVRKLLDVRRESFPESRVDWPKLARELSIRCILECVDSSSSVDDFPRAWAATLEFFGGGANDDHRELVRNLENTEQRLFPDPDDAVDWRTACEELVRPLDVDWWRPKDDDDDSSVSLTTFSFLAKCGIPRRANDLRVAKWRTAIEEMIESIPSVCACDLAAHFEGIHSRLASYELEYRRREEATSVLELALWKSRIDLDLRSTATTTTTMPRGRTTPEKVLSDDRRGRCRVDCGAYVIVPRVLSFLTGDE